MEYDEDYDDKMFPGLFKCSIEDREGVSKFVSDYYDINNDTVKIKAEKKCTNRSLYILCQYYRCQHDTRYVPPKNSKNK